MNITRTTRKLITAVFLAASALSWHGGSVAAVVQEVRVLFEPATITLPDTTDLVIEVKTSQGNIEAGMDIEVPLPTGLESVGAMTFSTECSANTANISTDSSVLRVTGLRSSPGRTCRMSVELGARTAGRYEFAAGSIIVRSEGQSTGNAQNAILDVLASPPAVFVATPASLDFGNQLVGTSSAPKTVTLRNDGGSPLTISGISKSGDFNYESDCPNSPNSLPPAGSCTLQVTFAPSANGLRTGLLQVASDPAASPLLIGLSGTGTEVERTVPQISPSSTALDFGTITSGSTALLRVRVESTGTAPVTVSAVGIDGDGFSRSHDCSDSLPPGEGCDIWVAFAPSAVGPHSGEIRITSNAVPSLLVIPLSGSALPEPTPTPTPAMQLSAGRITFGLTFVGTVSSPSIVTVTNAGTGPMHIASIESTGDFGYSGCGFPSTLMPGESCVFSITFRPLSEGLLEGAIRLLSDAPGSPHAILLSGAGALVLNPVISVTPAALDFGTLRVGSDETARMRLANVGNMALAISGITAAGAGFTQSNTCPASLAAGAFCDIAVTYAPTAVGTHSGQIRIDSNATPDRYVAALSGTAVPVPPPFMVVASTLDFGQQLTESVTRVTLEIKNSGGSPLIITRTQISGASVFGVDGSCGPIEPKGSCFLTMLFAPATAGVFAARLEIASNHSAGVVRVELLGQGIARPRADLQLAVEGLGFGNQVVGSVSDERSVGLTNVGTLPLQFLGFIVPLDFLIDSSGCPAQLQPQQSCEIRVSFKPVVPGPRGGQLTISSNAVGAPHSISLTGTGCRFFTMGAARNPQRLCAP